MTRASSTGHPALLPCLAVMDALAGADDRGTGLDQCRGNLETDGSGPLELRVFSVQRPLISRARWRETDQHRASRVLDLGEGATQGLDGRVGHRHLLAPFGELR